MKKEYIAPELDIVSFVTEDVITTSLTDGGNEGVGDVTPWGAVQNV